MKRKTKYVGHIETTDTDQGMVEDRREEDDDKDHGYEMCRSRHSYIVE